MSFDESVFEERLERFRQQAGSDPMEAFGELIREFARSFREQFPEPINRNAGASVQTIRQLYKIMEVLRHSGVTEKTLREKGTGRPGPGPSAEEQKLLGRLAPGNDFQDRLRAIGESAKHPCREVFELLMELARPVAKPGPRSLPIRQRAYTLYERAAGVFETMVAEVSDPGVLAAMRTFLSRPGTSAYDAYVPLFEAAIERNVGVEAPGLIEEIAGEGLAWQRLWKEVNEDDLDLDYNVKSALSTLEAQLIRALRMLGAAGSGAPGTISLFELETGRIPLGPSARTAPQENAEPLPGQEEPGRDAPATAALSRRRLFELIADEVFRDGVVDESEREVLTSFGRFLKLDSLIARTLCQEALARYAAGALGSQRPLDSRELYEQALRLILADGTIDELEQKMLDGLRFKFGITDAEHAVMLGRARRKPE